MSSNVIGSLNFTEVIQRKIDFLLNNDIYPKEGNEESDRGELAALEKTLRDSTILTETEFVEKYSLELTQLKERSEGKPYSVEDGDDYYESYNNTLVSVLEILNPIHLFDIDG